MTDTSRGTLPSLPAEPAFKATEGDWVDWFDWRCLIIAGIAAAGLLAIGLVSWIVLWIEGG